jgi:hypothetical protein
MGGVWQPWGVTNEAIDRILRERARSCFTRSLLLVLTFCTTADDYTLSPDDVVQDALPTARQQTAAMPLLSPRPTVPGAAAATGGIGGASGGSSGAGTLAYYAQTRLSDLLFVESASRLGLSVCAV